jgi:hypothetical protein
MRVWEKGEKEEGRNSGGDLLQTKWVCADCERSLPQIKISHIADELRWWAVRFISPYEFHSSMHISHHISDHARLFITNLFTFIHPQS